MRFPDFKTLKERAIQFKNYDPEYWDKMIFDTETGGYVVQGTNKPEQAHDYPEIFEVAKAFAKQGSEVQILFKSVHYNSKIHKYYFGVLEGTEFAKKCPDFFIDGEFWEYESHLGGKNALNNMISHGAKQANKVIIKETSYTDNYITKITKQKPTLELYMFDGEKIKRIK